MRITWVGSGLAVARGGFYAIETWIPASAGMTVRPKTATDLDWIPVFTGMTKK
jgi:hypothetical protein